MDKTNPCDGCENRVSDLDSGDCIFYLCPRANDWQELTAAEVITPEEKAEQAEFEAQKDHDQIVGEFLRVLAECDYELVLLSDYINEDKLGVSPDEVTFANVSDARALLSKLREITESLGWDHIEEEA